MSDDIVPITIEINVRANDDATELTVTVTMVFKTKGQQLPTRGVLLALPDAAREAQKIILEGHGTPVKEAPPGH